MNDDKQSGNPEEDEEEWLTADEWFRRRIDTRSQKTWHTITDSVNFCIAMMRRQWHDVDCTCWVCVSLKEYVDNLSPPN